MNFLSHRSLTRLAVAGALTAALALAGCGRKGGLDPPPSAAVSQPGQDQGQGQGQGQRAEPERFDEEGRPVAPPATQKKHIFFLDWLLD